MRRIIGLLGIVWATAASGAEPSIAWSELGYRAAVSEAQAQGPSAVAVDGSGRAYVLDRLNHRIVRLGHGAERVAPASEDSDLLAIGADGTIATYSALRSRVDLVSSSGASLGSIMVPRVIGAIGAITVGRSHEVTVTVALQERFNLGGPRFPATIESTLHGVREGAVELPDGTGVAAAVKQGVARLILTKPGSKAEITRTLASGVDAAHLVGTDSNVVCARVEQLRSGGIIDVSRRVVCVDATTGDVRLDRALPAPGTYAPRSELAVGHGQVVLMHPTQAGMNVFHYAFEGGAR